MFKGSGFLAVEGNAGSGSWNAPNQSSSRLGWVGRGACFFFVGDGVVGTSGHGIDLGLATDGSFGCISSRMSPLFSTLDASGSMARDVSC